MLGEGCRGGPGRLTAHCSPPAPERCGLRSVDHRLRLFLDVEVFSDAQEEFQCCFKVCASSALPCPVPPCLFLPQQTVWAVTLEPRGLASSLNAIGDSHCGSGPPPWYLSLRSLPFPMGRTLLTSQGVWPTWEPVSAAAWCSLWPLLQIHLALGPSLDL